MQYIPLYPQLDPWYSFVGEGLNHNTRQFTAHCHDDSNIQALPNTALNWYNKLYVFHPNSLFIAHDIQIQSTHSTILFFQRVLVRSTKMQNRKNYRLVIHLWPSENCSRQNQHQAELNRNGRVAEKWIVAIAVSHVIWWHIAMYKIIFTLK